MDSNYLISVYLIKKKLLLFRLHRTSPVVGHDGMPVPQSNATDDVKEGSIERDLSEERPDMDAQTPVITLSDLLGYVCKNGKIKRKKMDWF